MLIFDDYVLKIRPKDGIDTGDAGLIRWIAGRLPVPEIAAHEITDGKDWLLMTRIRGRMLCDSSVMDHPVLLLDCMAEALHRLWSFPVENCPSGSVVQTTLKRAEQAICSGSFDPARSEPGTFGPGGFESPEALLNWLMHNQPLEDPVLVHGDFCLPNLFTDGKRLSGFVDVGNMGIGDHWMDLALGWRSLKYNSDGHYGRIYPAIDPDDLFRAAGVDRDEERLRYYLFLDELN